MSTIEMAAAQSSVREALERIDAAWLAGRPRDMTPFLDEDIEMVLPGFSDRIRGRDAFLAGFEDFCKNARMIAYRPDAPRISATSATAVADYAYDMTYERDGSTGDSKGRDVWVFERRGSAWIAVWRAMLDVAETPHASSS